MGRGITVETPARPCAVNAGRRYSLEARPAGQSEGELDTCTLTGTDAPMRYRLFDTAIGTVGVAWSEHGLTRLQLPECDPAQPNAGCAGVSPIRRRPSRHRRSSTRRGGRELSGGRAGDFSTPALDLAASARSIARSTMRRAASAGARRYLRRAGPAAPGRPDAARAVGQAMGRNPSRSSSPATAYWPAAARSAASPRSAVPHQTAAAGAGRRAPRRAVRRCCRACCRQTGDAAPPLERLSLAEARRIALAAQGFGTPRDSRRSHQARSARRLIERLGVVQIDSVNVLARAHTLPPFSRLGRYRRAGPARARLGGRKRALFEYWGHEASLLPVATASAVALAHGAGRGGEGIYGAHRAASGASAAGSSTRCAREIADARPARGRRAVASSTRAKAAGGAGPTASARWSGCSGPAR